jgi:hypothetical protein
MAQLYRFGRRVPLPSTRQIMHDLRVMAAQEDAKQRTADANSSQAHAHQAANSDVAEAPRAAL